MFSNKKSLEEDIYTVRRSERHVKCIKQVNLLMIADGKKRHYITTKSMSRLLSRLNGKTKRAYHYCMNCLNGFRTSSARDEHYEYCSRDGHVKVNMPTEEEKCLKFYDGQYQFMLPFILYADFESVVKLVDERYREKMNKGWEKKRQHTRKNKQTNTVRIVCTQYLCSWRCT